MRLPATLSLLLGAALLSSAAWAQTVPMETKMTTKKSEKTASAACPEDTALPHKGNGGIARGPGAKANGGSNSVGRNTGNGGVAIGPNAEASGGDNNVGLPSCDGTAKTGNGGTAKGRNSKANGGNGNTVSF